MLLFKQLELLSVAGFGDPGRAVSDHGDGISRQHDGSRPAPSGRPEHGDRAPWLQHSGRDFQLEARAHALLRATGAARIASVRVVWNSRLKTAAGRADYRAKVISLNPRLHDHGAAEIDRTLRHELAHFLAQFRVGRRRLSPHGPEWRLACRDLGIAGELRCHTLPFPIRERAKRFFYRCPNCQRDFARVRRIRRVIACLACCRAHNRGQFDARFRLRPVEAR